MTCVRNAIDTAVAALSASDSARLDAEILLAHVLQVPRSHLYAAPEQRLDTTDHRRYQGLVEQRRGATPLAYLTGVCEFWSLDFVVNPAVLIPRPETELLVERALDMLPSNGAPRVIDLGTGCGAVAAAIARERPRAQVFASDKSITAATLARHNFVSLELGRITLVVADWLDALADQVFDVLVSNPPYIAANEMDLLDPCVLREPADALLSGVDGLDALRKIVLSAVNKLRPHGTLIVEHGYAQGAAVRELFSMHGYCKVQTFNDLAGHERVTQGSIEG